MDDPKEVPTPPPGEASAKPPEGAVPAVPPSPFDGLMITPEEAAARSARPAPAPAAVEPEAPEEDEPVLLTEVVEKICRAIDRLARKGLNFRAVVALLHDANPSIPKKQIKAVLESLRELPAIYGRTDNDTAKGPRTK